MGGVVPGFSRRADLHQGPCQRRVELEDAVVHALDHPHVAVPVDLARVQPAPGHRRAVHVALGPGPHEAPLAVEDHHRLLAPVEDVDVVVLVDGDAGDALPVDGGRRRPGAAPASAGGRAPGRGGGVTGRLVRPAALLSEEGPGGECRPVGHQPVGGVLGPPDLGRKHAEGHGGDDESCDENAHHVLPSCVPRRSGSGFGRIHGHHKAGLQARSSEGVPIVRLPANTRLATMAPTRRGRRRVGATMSPRPESTAAAHEASSSRTAAPCHLSGTRPGNLARPVTAAAGADAPSAPARRNSPAIAPSPRPPGAPPPDLVGTL